MLGICHQQLILILMSLVSTATFMFSNKRQGIKEWQFTSTEILACEQDGDRHRKEWQDSSWHYSGPYLILFDGEKPSGESHNSTGRRPSQQTAADHTTGQSAHGCLLFRGTEHLLDKEHFYLKELQLLWDEQLCGQMEANSLTGTLDSKPGCNQQSCPSLRLGPPPPASRTLTTSQSKAGDAGVAGHWTQRWVGGQGGPLCTRSKMPRHLWFRTGHQWKGHSDPPVFLGVSQLRPAK